MSWNTFLWKSGSQDDWIETIIAHCGRLMCVQESGADTPASERSGSALGNEGPLKRHSAQTHPTVPSGAFWDHPDFIVLLPHSAQVHLPGKDGHSPGSWPCPWLPPTGGHVRLFPELGCFFSSSVGPQNEPAETGSHGNHWPTLFKNSNNNSYRVWRDGSAVWSTVWSFRGSGFSC